MPQLHRTDFFRTTLTAESVGAERFAKASALAGEYREAAEKLVSLVVSSPGNPEAQFLRDQAMLALMSSFSFAERAISLEEVVR